MSYNSARSRLTVVYKRLSRLLPATHASEEREGEELEKILLELYGAICELDEFINNLRNEVL